MAREKKLREKKKGVVEMSVVNQLIILRDQRNKELKGTGECCCLRPNMSKKSCKTCPENERKYCEKYQWEREYILKKEKTYKSKKCKHEKEDKESLVFIDCVSDSIEDKYLCKEFNSVCPEREKCDYGENCPYKKTK